MTTENTSNAQSLILTDETTRKIRKDLTRRKGGGFEVCDDHERRMRADSFQIAIYADPTQASVIVKATATVSCGHSKRPCKDSRTITLADAAGVSARALRAVGAPEEPDEDSEEATA